MSDLRLAGGREAQVWDAQEFSCLSNLIHTTSGLKSNLNHTKRHQQTMLESRAREDLDT